MSVWGKAGQRLTPAEIEQRAQQRRARRNQGQAFWDQALPEARVAWSSGWVRPWLITMWLDYAGQQGPEVDRALGVPDPTVDRWEAGTQYPTWDQLVALARLCGVHPLKLTREEPGDADRVHLCPPPHNTAPTITTYTPAALAAAGITDRAPQPGALR